MKTPTLPAALGAQPAASPSRASGKAAAETLNAFDAALLALMLGVPAATSDPAGETAKGADPQALPGGETPALGEGASASEVVPELPATLLAMLMPLDPAPARATAAIPADLSPEGELAVAAPGPGADLAEARSRPVPDLGVTAAVARTAVSPLTGLAPPAASPGVPVQPATAGKASEHPATALLQSFAPALARAEEAGLLRREAAADASAPVSLPDFQPVAKAETLATTSQAAAQAAAPLVGDPATPAWREGLAERVALHVRGGRTEAQIQLHPADLGPIDVRIKVEDGLATLQFEAHRPETRLAIEEAIPRLKEMLADSGLQFGGAQVGHGDGTGEQGGRARAGLAAAARAESGAEAAAEAPRMVPIVPRGRVDLFA